MIPPSVRTSTPATPTCPSGLAGLKTRSLDRFWWRNKRWPVFSGMPLAKQLGHIFEEDAGGLVGNSRSALREDITKLVSFYPDGAGKIDQVAFATVFRGLLLQQQLEVS